MLEEPFCDHEGKSHRLRREWPEVTTILVPFGVFVSAPALGCLFLEILLYRKDALYFLLVFTYSHRVLFLCFKILLTEM